MMSREWQQLDPGVRAMIETHQAEAPVKIASLARDLRVSIKASTLSPGISGEIRPDSSASSGFIIRINRHDPTRRQRFTAAHELAHFLLHRNQIGAGIADDVLYRSALSDRREAEANRLAADLLMPDNLVQESLRTAQVLKVEDVLSYIADRLEVSEAAMKIRLGIE